MVRMLVHDKVGLSRSDVEDGIAMPVGDVITGRVVDTVMATDFVAARHCADRWLICIRRIGFRSLAVGSPASMPWPSRPVPVTSGHGHVS
jgi:hypothetical protein